MAITKDQIFQAADQLTTAGESATMAAVRKLLGGGSYTTINEGLKEWKAKQQATVTPIREPAPEGISKRLDDVGAEIWAIALELANARLTAEREALEATRIQLETAQQEATELADQLSGELETLQANYEQAMTDLETVSTHLGQARHENATLSRQLATTEARAEETTKRADDLKAELQHAHTTNAGLLDALKPAKAAVSVPPLDQIDLGL
jgi:chromosome segregation ATPase